MATANFSRLFSHISREISRRLASTRSNYKFINIATDTCTGVATLMLNRAPANALNMQLMRELTSSLEVLESSCSGLIITSAPGSIFCAGLDLQELRRSDPQHLRNVWKTLQCMWRTLFSSAIPTAVAINGHAPAGGCLLAISCDYRVMVRDYKIGLNETRVGLAVPSWLIDCFVHVLPSRRDAERALTQGRLINCDEALTLGLVDAVVENDVQAVQKCEDFLNSHRGVDAKTRADTKMLMRSGILAKFETEKEEDLDNFLTNVQSQEMQQFLEDYLQQMRRKDN